MIEFVEFKERLESSHTLAVTTSEQSLIRIRKAIPRGFADVQSALQAASKDQSSELPSVEQLRFNEDLSTRPAWLPPCGDPWGGALIDWWHAQHFTQCDAGTAWRQSGSPSCCTFCCMVTKHHISSSAIGLAQLLSITSLRKYSSCLCSILVHDPFKQYAHGVHV